MARRLPGCLGSLVALGVVLAACDGDDGSTRSPTRDAASPMRSANARLAPTVPARCDVGERPGYFIPGDHRLALLGCVRLGVSGRRVELSGSLSRIDGKHHLCINPAYSGRGHRGFYIPALCKLEPPPPRFAVHDAQHPRQGVRGYRFVVWGTAEPATSAVVAHFDAGSARAAVINVDAKLARTLGQPPFSLFVVELPLAAACGSVTLRSDDPAAAERLGPRRRLCARVTGAAG